MKIRLIINGPPFGRMAENRYQTTIFFGKFQLVSILYIVWPPKSPGVEKKKFRAQPYYSCDRCRGAPLVYSLTHFLALPI